MTALLEFDGVSSYYGTARALKDVSFEIGEGESVGLIGRNGAGKSTTALSAYGVPSRVEGEIRVRGSRVRTRHTYDAAKHGVALVPQGRYILPNLTVAENLRLGAAPRRRGEWTLESVYELFPVLRERQRSLGTRLSGGQQQMLAVGRALMSNPSLLVLDEPTEGLSPVMIDNLTDALLRIREHGTALLLIEQHLRVVTELTERYVLLVKGEVKAQGRTEEIEGEDMLQWLAV